MALKVIKVAIVGITGYSGLELLRLKKTIAMLKSSRFTILPITHK